MNDLPSPRWLTPAALTLGAAVLLINAWPSWLSVVDDAYISARYAAQLAAGNGLVFSAGQTPVEGYSNPLWTILLAALLAIGVPVLPAMIGMGVVFGLLSLPLVLGITQQLTGSRDVRTATPVLLTALSPYVAVSMTNGLESSMMLAVVLATVWAFLALDEGRWRVGLLAGLVGWTRPEGFGITLLVVAFELWVHRKDLRKAMASAGAAIGLLALLFGARFVIYGRWLPNTYDAKSSFPITETWTVNDQYLMPERWPLMVALGAWLLGSVMPPWSGRKAMVSAVAIVLAGVQLTVNLWMPALRYFLAPMSLAACLLVAASFRLPARASLATCLGLIGAMAFFLVGSGDRVRGYDGRHTVQPGNGAQRAGEHLAAYLKPEAVLATRDAGVLAFYVGTSVRMAEIHNRALTQPHDNGADVDIRAFTPTNPEVFAATVQRDHADKIAYANDRKVFEKLTQPYTYLGRVEQHYHRYYDIYVRSDLGIPPLPPEIVVNFNGPQPRIVGEAGAPPPEEALPDTGR